MSRRATPFTIIRCSFGECQCHGTVHPVSALARMMEGPLAGSPLFTEPGVQPGSPGNALNWVSAMFCPTAWPPIAWPHAKPTRQSTNGKASVARQNFDSFLIDTSSEVDRVD